MMHWGKKALAALLSVAMTVTMLPVGGMSVKAAETKAPVLHYDMSHADGKLTDVSGNGYDGTLQGITDSDFTTEGESTILNFDGSDKYVEIPSGSITNEKFTIEATYSDSTKSNAWLFTLGSVRGSWPNVKNYLFVSPVSSDEKYDGKMLAAIKDDSTEYRYPTSKLLTSDTTKDNVVTVVFSYGNVTYYINGEASDVTETDISIMDLLGTGSTEECMGYIGRSLYTGDSNYKGTVRDFKIYDYAMTKEEVVSNYEAASVEIMKNSVLKSAQETMLNGNNPSEVISDLVFPAEIQGVSLNWTSSDTTAIDATGKYVYEGEESKEVTISVTGTKDNAEFLKKDWKITVTNKLFIDMNALTIPNMDNIKGNITLPTTGKTGSSITWASDKPEVISVTETGNQGYDNTPAGVVTRQAADTKVKLTATITTEDQKSKTKDFNVTVKAKTQTDELTDYVFAYFIGDGAGQEKIFLATSQDGLNWEEINDAEPFLESDLGEKGLRDPYIFRSAEGDKFYLIATDLQIAAGNGWTAAQQAGSQAIMVWESDDLVHWSEQRMVTVSAEIEAGCTWAPEVFYDEKTGEYIVFWASKTKPNEYDRQRLYYCKTRDFYTFTEPKLWIEKTFSVIDTTVVRDDDGTYYRFTKNEDGDAKYIFLEKSQSMLGEWESVSSTSLESEKWVEGPCCFRFNDDDIEKAGGKWGVLLDDFGGIGYYPMITSDLATAEFTKLTTANLPKIKKPRHGTVMRITSAEYDALMGAYGVKVNDKNIPEVVTTDSGYTLPTEINVAIGRQEKKVAVTWDVTKDAFEKAGTVTATATIPELNNQTVSVTIEVISAKLIYYIDSGVGDWNENLKESGIYNKVAELLTLRNNKPDQLYTAGSWGFVNDSSSSIAGNRTSTTDSIYANGWWAKKDKECEYILPLESGTYTATGYFGEWWGTTRPMKFCVKYTDDNNKEVTQEVSFTISSSASQQEVSLNFKVENVAETAEVHLSSIKTGDADPVIAGLSVEKTADAKTEAEITKGWEQITVPGTKTIQEGNTEEISVNYPEGFLDSLSKNGLTISKALTSSDKEVVGITEDGKITAKLAGTADITTKITLSDKRTKEFTTKVTVTAKPSEKDTAIAAVNKDWDKITVSPASKTIQEGNTELIIVNYPGEFLDNVSKAGLTISKTYTSNNTTVAEVAQNGKITAKKAGTATITTKITLSNKKTKSFTTKVTVTAKPSTEIPVKTLTLNKTKLTLELNKTYNLKATIAPSNATNKKLSWTSSAPKTVSVSNGKLTAKKVGSADIMVTAGGKIATCKVTVKVGVKKVTLNKKSVTLGVKETFALKTTITPKNATNKTVKWTSDKKNIASVNSKGVVTAKKAGKAKITATVDGKKVTCTVTVKKAPSKITLNKKSVSLKKNKTFQIKVTLPKNTASNKITYKSNKPKIASVTSSGKVKALKKGSATITVQTFNKKKATLKVTVK